MIKVKIKILLINLLNNKEIKYVIKDNPYLHLL